MDVSGWTIDQRMRLPDWCFGNRRIVSAYVYETVQGQREWEISEHALPDPACIWRVEIISEPNAGKKGAMRIALSHVVPTSEAGMTNCQELLEGLGRPREGPNDILLNSGSYLYHFLDVRKGMVTGGKHLVVEIYAVGATMRVTCNLIVSGLPTSMAGWLAHNK